MQKSPSTRGGTTAGFMVRFGEIVRSRCNTASAALSSNTTGTAAGFRKVAVHSRARAVQKESFTFVACMMPSTVIGRVTTASTMLSLNVSFAYSNVFLTIWYARFMYKTCTEEES